MPEVSPVQQSSVRAAIARASAATGVDFDYLLAQAKIESVLDPSARAKTSSAAGLYQFTAGTWLETLERHGARHGLGWSEDPALRPQVMNLRFDPDASALMAAELARDNAGELRSVLGRDPDAAELYLAHFLGAAGARSFLTAHQSDPGQPAATLFPQAASANRAIFYDEGRGRSVGEVLNLIRGKVSGAMESGFQGRGFHAPAPRLRAISPEQPARMLSMAETLQSTFGSSGGLPGGERVQKAYSVFRTFGL